MANKENTSDEGLRVSYDVKTYHEQKYIDYTLRLREILKTLPSFAKDYFRAIEPTTSAKTRISYAYDIRVFFRFLMENNPVYKNYTINQFTLADIENLEPVDIEEYQEYLKVYKNDEKQVTNTEKGLARKMSALRSFYGYYFKRQAISKNPTLLVDMPKLHEKAIIRLDADEVVRLLDYVDHGGDHLTGQKKAYFEKTRNRDLAILTLLLGTGIRVSECVGLDINDVDFENNRLSISKTYYRSGGEDIITTPKTEQSVRTIELPEFLTKEIKDYTDRVYGMEDDDRLFPIVAEAVQRKFRRHIEKAGVKKIRVHALRHSHCAYLIHQGVAPLVIKERLGHTDIKITLNTYGHLYPNQQRQVADMLNSKKENTSTN